MAQIANLVLPDGQTTPVNKTFTARRADTQLATWQDLSSGLKIGFPTVTLSVNDSSSKITRITGRVVVPTLEVISGADGGYTPIPRVAYECQAKIEFLLPNRCTLQERKNLHAFLAYFNTGTAFRSAVENYEAPW